MKGSSARRAIISEGVKALSREGFAGVTIGRVAEASGLSKSGLFAHFRSRQALELALIDESTRLAWLHVIEPAMPAPAGIPRLRAVVDGWLGWSSRAGLPGGCPVASALFELDDVAGTARARIAELDGEWRALLLRLAGEAVTLGQMREDADLHQFIWELCGIYLAHHAFTRFHRDAGADQRASTALDLLFQRYAMPRRSRVARARQR